MLAVTAEVFCRTLYDAGVEYVNRGVYPGTDIPLRPVPTTATLTVCSTPLGYAVTDDDGGWIADRVCGGSIGARQLRKLQAALSTHNSQENPQ